MATIWTFIEKGTRCSGHYFKMWRDCSEELQREYLSRRELPQRPIRANGEPVEQIHAITNEVVKRFSSIAHVQTEMRIARASLQRALADGGILKGYKWKRYDPSAMNTEETSYNEELQLHPRLLS